MNCFTFSTNLRDDKKACQKFKAGSIDAKRELRRKNVKFNQIFPSLFFYQVHQIAFKKLQRSFCFLLKLRKIYKLEREAFFVHFILGGPEKDRFYFFSGI